MQTRQYPRTMQQAFGPYTDHRIAEDPPVWDWQDAVVFGGCVVVALVLAGLRVAGVVL
jgi:hypothetical protein